MLEWLGAGELSGSMAVALVALAAFTSLMTAALGLGGGLLLLLAMTSVVPLAVLIPVHASVQLGSNANRAIMLHRHIDRRLLPVFVVGALLGAVFASLVIVQLPLAWLQLAIGSFVLFLMWGTLPGTQRLNRPKQLLIGALTTFVSMFVGATGPLVAGFIHRHYPNKMSLSGTFAACMTVQHLIKVIVFSISGFVFWQWLPLIVSMIASGAVGTWLGLKLLNRIPELNFKRVFKVVVSLLAIRLLWLGASAIFQQFV